MQQLIDEMAQRVIRHAADGRKETAIPRLGIGVIRAEKAPVMTGCGSGACLVLQGSKQMLVGNQLLNYRAGSCFVSLIDLPTTRIQYENKSSGPYIATSLKFDHALFTSVLAELPAQRAARINSGYHLAAVSEPLLHSWNSLLALLDTPDDIPFLAALRERELVYRLIQSPHGPLLRQIAAREGRLMQIGSALHWLRIHFDQRIAAQALANIAGMSLPSFNRHFRLATGTSPLQYQKTLRLQAARRLLLNNQDAIQAAFAVGYESPSQFSREYARLYGKSPKKDAAGLRAGIGLIPENLI